MSAAIPASGERDVSGETSVAVEFLQRWAAKGPWILTAIASDRRSIQTRTFTADTASAMREWIDGFNGERNVYFHVNPCTRELSKKAEREDVAALAWLHVDIDPRVGEDIEEERARALGLLTDNLPRGVPPPTVVIFSGGGYQGFWRLGDPFPIDGDLARAEEAKRWNLQLELLFGADNCHNVDRIMRLPGTVNIPDRKKLEKGRTRVTAELVEFHDDRVYPLSEFTPAPEVQSPGSEGFGPAPDIRITGEVERLASVEDLDRWGVPDRVKVIIVQGRIPDEPKEGDDSRSAWLFDAVCQLVRHEVPDEVIYSVITDPDFHISESVLEKGSDTHRYAVRQIQSAYAKVACDPAPDRSGADQRGGANEEPTDADEELPRLIDISDFRVESLPLRPWLMEGLLMDGHVTLVAARGGAGKSLFSMQVAVACALGGSFAYWRAARARNVLVLNAEDDLDEQRRRLESACRSMGVDRSSLRGRLFHVDVSSLVLVAADDDGKRKRTPLFQKIIRLARENDAGLIVFDPLVECHSGLDENSNADMKEVILAMRDIARMQRLSVLAIHHSRKSATSGDQDGARGGSALVNAVRVALTITPMAEEEARQHLPRDQFDERGRYLRVSGAKANYAARLRDSWLHIEGHDLCNAGTNPGDNSPGLVLWEPECIAPDSDTDLASWPEMNRLLDRVERGLPNGDRYTSKVTGPRAPRLNALLEEDFGLPAVRARDLLRRLLDEGWLIADEHYVEETRKKNPGRLFTHRECRLPAPTGDGKLPF